MYKNLINEFNNPLFTVGESSNFLDTFGTPTDIKEDDKNYIIMIEVPGVIKEDLKITINDGYIRISGKKKEENKTEAENYIRLERTFGNFRKSIRISDDIDIENINAKYENGILKIVLPKLESESASIKEIKINDV